VLAFEFRAYLSTAEGATGNKRSTFILFINGCDAPVIISLVIYLTCFRASCRILAYQKGCGVGLCLLLEQGRLAGTKFCSEPYA
jgi:hypothetical protein